jgi:hypothetical protein
MSKSYDKFVEEALEALSNFPDLQLCIREDSLPYLSGNLILSDENDVMYDEYFIKIECPDDYPNNFPLVYEINERLPHNIDWHIYRDGHFCICTPIEEYIHCAKGITLTLFIQKQVLPYLHNQSFREKEGYFLNERSHGSIGILESLYEILHVNDLIKVYSLLIYIYRNNPPSRTSKCFCGGGQKYRYCHRQAYYALKSIGQDRLLGIISYLKRIQSI